MQDTEIQDLISNFLTKIYSRGLFKEADDSEYKNLVSKEGEISVISLCLCETQIVTISKGVECTPEYRQVSFASHIDEPIQPSICEVSNAAMKKPWALLTKLLNGLKGEIQLCSMGT